MGLGAPLLLPLLHPLFLGAAGAMLTLYTAPETRAALGSVALLKCRFNVGRPIDPAVLRVRWLSAAAGPVAQYDRGQGTFEPRLRLSEQELQIGNASLEVQDVAVQDNGTYTCEVAYGTETQLGKTTLWVLAAPRISLDQRVGGAETSLLCHVGGFFPEDMEATLLRDEQVLNGSTRSSPQRNQDGTFNLTLTYTFTPVRSDAGAVFTCRVRHPVLGQPLVEEFALDVPGSDRTGAAIGAVVAIVLALGAAGAASYCWRQRRGRKAACSVSKVEGPERCRLGQEVTLRCSVEGKIRADTAVTWERTQGEDRALIQKDGPRAAPEHQLLFPSPPPGWTSTQERSETGLTALLTFTPTVQDHGARVRCLLQPEARDSGEEPECWEIRVWAPPELSRIQVLARWDPPDQVPFAVHLHGFYPNGIHRVEWSMDGKAWERSEPSYYAENEDGTFSARSVWRVASRCLARPEQRVRVRVQHGPADPPIAGELSIGDTGVLRPPEVSVISWPQSVMAGREVTLSCRVAGHFPAELGVTWLRKGRGAARAAPLQDSAEHRLLPGRPAPAADGKSFVQEAGLVFTPSVRRDHGAEYTCRVEHVALAQPVAKHSAELQVRALPDVSRIQVLPRWDSPDQVPFAVRLHGFYPRGIHRIAWSWDGEAWQRSEPSDYKENEEGTFSARSVWRVPSRRLARPEQRVQVCVQHGPADPPVTGELSIGDAGVLRPPEVSVISWPQSVMAGREVALSCRMAGHFPAELGVTWLRKGRGAARAAPLQDSAEHRLLPGWPAPAVDGKSFVQEAGLVFTPSVRRDHGAEYICRVEHVALAQPVAKHSAELQVRALPDVSGIQVLPRWDPPDQVPFAVRLHGFYPRGIHRIAWSWDGEAWQRSELSDYVENEDGTFSARSVWRVPSWRLARPEQRVQVRVQHGPADPPVTGELSIGDAGLLRPPEVSAISRPQSVMAGRAVTLSCHITGRFPELLGVTWLRRDRGAARAAPLRDSAEHQLLPGQPAPATDGKSFVQEAGLVFTPSVHRDHGAEYTCRVEHVALRTPVEQRSGELQVTGGAAQDQRGGDDGDVSVPTSSAGPMGTNEQDGEASTTGDAVSWTGV
ncbi:uncharacterized protein LOC102566895 isoform X2 [Alligator mississippiensis]|uniref:uncharacterized protein LOC102566895 isoform X2 n=1 Tax=Alligator mississippiensis TaxID=8496 RepID=UPI0028780950|nr:uncharacterized protein LOC102566895 isoform X2 [Alligator mississippiensis]